MIRLKAEAQAEALRLINEILSQNRDLITYQYVDKLGPGVQVMLVPNDNPYLLPLPEMLGPNPPEEVSTTPETLMPDITDVISATATTDVPEATATPTPQPTSTP